MVKNCTLSSFFLLITTLVYAQQPSINSIYTELSSPTCTQKNENLKHCKGISDFNLEIQNNGSHDAFSRESINVITPQKKTIPLNYWRIPALRTVGLGFEVGKKAEWRVKTVNNEHIPIALIVRERTYNYGDTANLEINSFLVITKITADEICVTDTILTNNVENANLKARELADNVANKPCLSII